MGPAWGRIAVLAAWMWPAAAVAAAAFPQAFLANARVELSAPLLGSSLTLDAQVP